MDKKIKYVTAKDNADLEKIQDRAVKSINSARVSIQVALVATVLHIAKHGNYTVAQRLVDGLGNSVNGVAVVEWFKRFGKLSTSDEGFNGIANDFSKLIAASLEEAKAKMWWELKPINAFKGYNAEAALQQFIKTHKSFTAKLMTMPLEDQAKVDVSINDATIKQVLALCNFDAIIDEQLKQEVNKDQLDLNLPSLV